MILYHGGTDIVKEPNLASGERSRDFGVGFYTTDIHEQAMKWAIRQGQVRGKQAILNIYEFDEDRAEKDLKFKNFTEYSLEWLNFVVSNRAKRQSKHDFDIVFGKIANDDVGETVQAVIDGLTPPDFALQKLKFMQANNQYAFCTEKALSYIKFSDAQNVGQKMSHGTVRAATLKTIIPLIMEHFNCGENEALKKFYESHIGACYADDNTGLYGQSAYYVADLFFEECENN